MEGQQAAGARLDRRESVLDEVPDILVANTLGQATLAIIARGEELSTVTLLRDLMEAALADETLEARLAFSAWKRIQAL